MRPTSKSGSDSVKAGSDSVKALSKPLAITAGEPAGIGPELCLALASTTFAQKLVVIADIEQLSERARRVGSDVQFVEYDIAASAAAAPGHPVLTVLSQSLPEPGVCGTPVVANARTLLDGLDRAIDGCRSGEFSGLVTAPLQKSIINDAGIPFSGHTEYLAERTRTPVPVMLLVAGQLRVALASTHLPLRDVPDFLTQARLAAVIEVLHADLISRFSIPDPNIIVCGLNPHAGEGGHLGSEDQEIIAPVIREMQQKGFNVRGPVPADTAFTANAGDADAVLAMYHDQGLPVLKFAGFGNAVNVTLGLPIIRTSVDHGTALDLAGSGNADTGSMLAAVALAAELAAR